MLCLTCCEVLVQHSNRSLVTQVDEERSEAIKPEQTLEFRTGSIQEKNTKSFDYEPQ